MDEAVKDDTDATVAVSVVTLAKVAANKEVLIIPSWLVAADKDCTYASVEDTLADVSVLAPARLVSIELVVSGFTN